MAVVDRTRDLEPPPAEPIGWNGVRLDAMLAESERLFADTGRYHGLDMGRGEPGMSLRWGTGTVQITSVDLLRDGVPTEVLRTRDALTIRLHYRCETPVVRPVFGVAIHRDDGTHVTGPNTRTSGFPIDRLEGSGAFEYAIDQLPLLPGRYLVSAAVYDEDLITALDHRERLVPFVVVEGGTAERLGVIALDAAWRRAGVWEAS